MSSAIGHGCRASSWCHERRVRSGPGASADDAACNPTVLRLLDLIPLERAVLDPERARHFVEAGGRFALQRRDLLVDFFFVEVGRNTVDGNAGLAVGERDSQKYKA